MDSSRCIAGPSRYSIEVAIVTVQVRETVPLGHTSPDALV